jgi:SAM-dependent methyltransferase
MRFTTITRRQKYMEAQINEQKMNELIGRVVSDLGASLGSSLTYLGQKLGLFKALANKGPMNSTELASATGTVERYVREWLINQSAGGYVEYDPSTGRYSMTPEQVVALTDETSPFFVGGGFYVTKAMSAAVGRIEESFRNGGGMLWGEHDPDLFLGTELFFRPSYIGNLINGWLPALSGVTEKLTRGGKAADVGCGHGASTIILAHAFPKSHFYGFDNHAESIHRARQLAADAGVADRTTFEVASASEFPGEGYDLVAFFDCYHDLGDPIGASKRAFQTLDADGSVMIVEPMAGDRVEQNFNPVGRIFSGASTLCCTPNSLAVGGPALGTVASDQALRETVFAAGFSSFQRVTETPFNRIFEARR